MENTTSPYINLDSSYVFRTGEEIIDWLNKREVKRFIPIIIFQCIIVITGVLGNGHVCYIYWPNRVNSAAKLFVFFIGVNDLISTGIVIPAELAFVGFQYNFPSEVLCVVSTVFVVWLTLCMATGLFAVTVDRFMVVCKPNGWQFNFRRAKFTCILIAVATLVCSLGIPVLKVRGISSSNILNVTTSKCSYLESEISFTSLKFWYLLCGAIVFGGAVILILVMNCLISIRLFRQSREAGEIYEDEVLETSLLGTIMERSKERIILNDLAKKETISMVIVSTAFVLSYAPTLVSMIVQNAKNNFWIDISHEARIAVLLFQQSFKVNYVINPAIYLKYDSHFRKECKRILPGIFNNCVNRLRRCRRR